MSSTPNTADLAWDDGHLWTDDDATEYLQLPRVKGADGSLRAATQALDELEDLGAPTVRLAGHGRRWHPDRLRTWAALGGTRPTAPTSKPKRRQAPRFTGSGRAVEQP